MLQQGWTSFQAQHARAGRLLDLMLLMTACLLQAGRWVLRHLLQGDVGRSLSSNYALPCACAALLNRVCFLEAIMQSPGCQNAAVASEALGPHVQHHICKVPCFDPAGRCL